MKPTPRPPQPRRPLPILWLEEEPVELRVEARAPKVWTPLPLPPPGMTETAFFRARAAQR
ncbi:MAG: hypothetical protein RJA22_680 [Verrucomicrobiota bacterium]|jgi:hypothetical protein